MSQVQESVCVRMAHGDSILFCSIRTPAHLHPHACECASSSGVQSSGEMQFPWRPHGVRVRPQTRSSVALPAWCGTKFVLFCLICASISQSLIFLRTTTITTPRTLKKSYLENGLRL